MSEVSFTSSAAGGAGVEPFEGRDSKCEVSCIVLSIDGGIGLYCIPKLETSAFVSQWAVLYAAIGMLRHADRLDRETPRQHGLHHAPLQEPPELRLARTMLVAGAETVNV